MKINLKTTPKDVISESWDAWKTAFEQEIHETISELEKDIKEEHQHQEDYPHLLHDASNLAIKHSEGQIHALNKVLGKRRLKRHEH